MSAGRGTALARARTILGRGEEGWTFMEVLIVIAIILLLTSAVGFMAFRYLDRARVTTAKNQLEAYSLALNAYYLDCKQYPTKEQGLDSLWEKPVMEPVPTDWNGPYVSKKTPKDPWGNPYDYIVPGPNGLPFGIRSFGQSGKEGPGNITSWE